MFVILSKLAILLISLLGSETVIIVSLSLIVLSVCPKELSVLILNSMMLTDSTSRILWFKCVCLYKFIMMH